MAGSEKATAEPPAPPLDGAVAPESAETRPYGYSFAVKTLDQICTDHVRFVLELLGWNFSQAAPALGVDRRTLYRMTQRWGIARPERHPKARAAPAPLIASEAEPGASDGLEEGAFTELTEESERLVPGTWGETVLASGSALPGGLIRDVLMSRAPHPEFGELPEIELVNLPRPSEAPPSVPPQEFENFGHLPTLESDK